MQTASITLHLAGDAGNTVRKHGVTPSEVVLLRAIHGDEAVQEIQPTDDIERTRKEELSRLGFRYGASRLLGSDSRAFTALFPGAAAPVFESFEELEIPETFYEAEVRAKPKKAEAKPAGKKAKAKAEAEPEVEAIDEDKVFG